VGVKCETMGLFFQNKYCAVEQASEPILRRLKAHKVKRIFYRNCQLLTRRQGKQNTGSGY